MSGTETNRLQATKERAWGLMVPLLLAAMLLLLSVIWITQMHPDETLVYEFTHADLGYTVQFLGSSDVHPPLWFSLFWLWRHLVGDSEFSGRMLSLLFSLITLALTYRLGRDWFGKPRYGWFAAAILTANAYFIDYALEIRPYALTMLLAALSMWVFERWRRRPTWRLTISYAVITAVMFYVHYFLAFLVLVQVIIFLLGRPARRQLLRGTAAAALAFGLWLPWLPSFLNQVSVLRGLAEAAGEVYGLGVGTPATTKPTDLDTIRALADMATNGLPLLYGLILLVGAAMLWRSARYRVVIAWALGVPAVALALNTVAAVYTPRYVVYLVVGLALALAAALAVERRNWLRYAALIAFVGGNLVLMPGALPERVPYRDVFGAMSAQPGDVVYFADGVDQFLTWQADAYLAPGFRRIEDQDLGAAAAARRVWFLTANWFDDDVRAQFKALEPTHPVQQVIGQCPPKGWCYYAQLMEAPPLAVPERFGADMDFWGADIDATTVGQITTRLWWRVEQAPALDYSFSLRLVDAAGGIVTQKDGPIIHYGVDAIQTSQLEPGKIYIDFRSVEYSPNLPPGSYRLELVVYQAWDGQRLTLPDGSDSLVLYRFNVD